MTSFDINTGSPPNEILCILRRARKEFLKRKGLNTLIRKIDMLIQELEQDAVISKKQKEILNECLVDISKRLSSEIIKSINANIRKARSRCSRGAHSLEISSNLYEKLKRIQSTIGQMDEDLSLADVIDSLAARFSDSSIVNIELNSEVYEKLTCIQNEYSIGGNRMSLADVIDELTKIYGFSRGIRLRGEFARVYSDEEEQARQTVCNALTLGKKVSLEKFLNMRKELKW